jgi:hypothetical protein
MFKLFHVNIQVKKMKFDCLFDLSSQSNLVLAQLVENLAL